MNVIYIFTCQQTFFLTYIESSIPGLYNETSASFAASSEVIFFCRFFKISLTP